jgi:hypothetical protein
MDAGYDRAGNISMTTRRASLDDSACTVISRPEPRTELVDAI